MVTSGKLPVVTSMKPIHLESLTALTLDLIERRRGIRGLSLREIARLAGCSHVNLYHHVGNLDQLIWHCYRVALERYRDWCRAHAGGQRGAQALPAYAWAVLDFAREHEGLYRLLWVDDLGGTPPSWVGETIGRVSAEYVEFVRDATGAAEARQVADIFGAWLAGRLQLLLSGRLVEDRVAAEAGLLADAARLAGLLTERAI